MPFDPPGWLPQDQSLKAITIVAVALVVAGFIDLIGMRLVLAVTTRTRGDLDDHLVRILRRPVAVSVLLVGLWYAIAVLNPPEVLDHALRGLFISIAAVYWAVVASRAGTAVLDHASRHGRGLVQTQTRPLFNLLLRVVVVAAAIYFVFLAWRIDVSAWIASAGIAGIAIGFAAQETLANLIAGFSILVDRPYKIGDYLVLEDGTRGRVTEIGMRSTRFLTRDDVEVIIPNSRMASARIINESGGPNERERVSAVVSVAYGSDIDQVRRVLLECAFACENVVKDDPANAPRTRFRQLGDSGLVIHLLVWVPQPELRGRVLDELNERIYKRFNAEGIEIPFPHHQIVLPKGKEIVVRDHPDEG